MKPKGIVIGTLTVPETLAFEEEEPITRGDDIIPSSVGTNVGG